MKKPEKIKPISDKPLTKKEINLINKAFSSYELYISIYWPGVNPSGSIVEFLKIVNQQAKAVEKTDLTKPGTGPCRNWDSGFCYAAPSLNPNAVNGACLNPSACSAKDAY